MKVVPFNSLFTVSVGLCTVEFVFQNVVANPTPSSELGVVTERPIHQNYAIEADRLSTFRQWPRDSNQSPEALAGAGFFYTGRPLSLALSGIHQVLRLTVQNNTTHILVFNLYFLLLEIQL